MVTSDLLLRFNVLCHLSHCNLNATSINLQWEHTALKGTTCADKDVISTKHAGFTEVNMNATLWCVSVLCLLCDWTAVAQWLKQSSSSNGKVRGSIPPAVAR